jgi:hypothetical protein
LAAFVAFALVQANDCWTAGQIPFRIDTNVGVRRGKIARL